MADSEYERKVVAEIDQLRRFLGVPRATSPISDDALGYTMAVIAFFLLVAQQMYSRTILIVAGLVVVRLLWIGLFSRGK